MEAWVSTDCIFNHTECTADVWKVQAEWNEHKLCVFTSCRMIRRQMILRPTIILRSLVSE